jgi:hypothetical protein
VRDQKRDEEIKRGQERSREIVGPREIKREIERAIKRAIKRDIKRSGDRSRKINTERARSGHQERMSLPERKVGGRTFVSSTSIPAPSTSLMMPLTLASSSSWAKLEKVLPTLLLGRIEDLEGEHRRRERERGKARGSLVG